MHAAVMIGTRPEAIKLAPVVLELRGRGIETTVIHSGQHADLVIDPFELFGIRPDIVLDTMRDAQSLRGLVGRLTTAVSDALASAAAAKPIDVLVVQGDTASTMVTALAGVRLGIPVVHVEAGLRTGDVRDPFPEEVNRMMVTMVADHHFAPTPKAAANLVAEDVPRESITVTGNTVVDAVEFVLSRYRDRLTDDRTELGLAGTRYIALTVHRRESWGARMRDILAGVRDHLETDSDLHLVFPVHPNPLVRAAANDTLAGTPNVMLIEPAGYRQFIAVLAGADLIVTDSGGVQEEAPTLGKHTLVVRLSTERTEGIEAGTATLVGVDRESVRGAIARALTNAPSPKDRNPFGDGQASTRIVDALVSRYGK